MSATPGTVRDDDACYRALAGRAQGTNVNAQTLLATDYLNHFNEVVMLFEMIPDMPELLDEARAWRPKGYKEHFADSSIADRDLAIEAYDAVPPRYREPFETTVAQLDRLVLDGVARLAHAMEAGDEARLRDDAVTLSRTVQRLMEVAGAIIHGSERTLDQAEIDALMDGG